MVGRRVTRKEPEGGGGGGKERARGAERREGVARRQESGKDTEGGKRRRRRENIQWDLIFKMQHIFDELHYHFGHHMAKRKQRRNNLHHVGTLQLCRFIFPQFLALCTLQDESN